MYCINCGKKIDKDSIFCQFCGTKNSDNTSVTPDEEKADDEVKVVETEASVKSAKDLLWDKFVEIYDAVGDERTKFNQLSSPFVWEFFPRISSNTFEQALRENREELNKQPYKVIEALKNMYTWSTVGGYKLWLSEALLKETKLNKIKSITLDKLIDQWSKDIDESSEYLKNITSELDMCITIFQEHRLNSFLDSAPTARDLSNEVIENIKNKLLWEIVRGYFVGIAESKFRK